KVQTDIWHSLTPAQQDEARVLEAAIAKLEAACRAQVPAPATCTPPTVRITREGTSPQFVHSPHGLILAPAWTLAPEFRAIMAHDLAHAWFADARDDCGTPAGRTRCEWRANFHAAEILVRGYGYDEITAARKVHALLVVYVQRGKPTPGHDDYC